MYYFKCICQMWYFYSFVLHSENWLKNKEINCDCYSIDSPIVKMYLFIYLKYPQYTFRSSLFFVSSCHCWIFSQIFISFSFSTIIVYSKHVLNKDFLDPFWSIVFSLSIALFRLLLELLELLFDKLNAVAQAHSVVLSHLQQIVVSRNGAQEGVKLYEQADVYAKIQTVLQVSPCRVIQ